MAEKVYTKRTRGEEIRKLATLKEKYLHELADEKTRLETLHEIKAIERKLGRA